MTHWGSETWAQAAPPLPRLDEQLLSWASRHSCFKPSYE
jgi:hypothetical protein